MQKMINLTLAIDVVFILAAFIILYFDKSNSANQLSKNLKSFFLGRKDKTINIKSALLFIDITMYSAAFIALVSLYNIFSTNIAVFVLLALGVFLLSALFPIVLLKLIVVTKKISHRALSSTH